MPPPPATPASLPLPPQQLRTDGEGVSDEDFVAGAMRAAQVLRRRAGLS